jgi:hypothetical protein
VGSEKLPAAKPPEVRRAHYLKKAADLRDMAAKARTEQARHELRRIASQYERMAEDLAPPDSQVD